MATVDEIVAQVVSRRPFAVLGYSAEDAVWCPSCLRSAGGLSPGRPDTCGKPVVPLFARDATVREEVCGNCGRELYDLLAAGQAATEPKSVSARLWVHGKRSALEFDRVPPIEVRTALKSIGWRWDPRIRVWWSSEETPRMPAGITVPMKSRSPALAGAPLVRKRR